ASIEASREYAASREAGSAVRLSRRHRLSAAGRQLLRRRGTARQPVRRRDVAAEGPDHVARSQPSYDLLDRPGAIEQVLSGSLRALDPVVSRSDRADARRWS